MIQNQLLKTSLSSVLLFSASFSANSITLMRGTATNLTGTLGDVQVNYVDDTASLTGYLGPGGAVINPAVPIPVKRVQYDLLNNLGNGSIFSFRVDYALGTSVIGALDPQGFYQGDGTQQTYWGGKAYSTLFDNGFGVYDYNIANSGEWTIDYQADHVTWNHIGNGFFADTATGLTNFGFNPTFSLDFAPDTILGLRSAEVMGRDATGAPVFSDGMVLSSVVPVPAAVWLFGSGLIGLVGMARYKKV